MTDPIAPVFHKAGNRRHELVLAPDGGAEWRRARVPGLRRGWLKWRGGYNPKTLERERRLADKRPLWWVLALGALVVLVPFLPNSLVQVAAIFCIFAAINVVWTLIIGAAASCRWPRWRWWAWPPMARRRPTCIWVCPGR